MRFKKVLISMSFNPPPLMELVDDVPTPEFVLEAPVMLDMIKTFALFAIALEAGRVWYADTQFGTVRSGSKITSFEQSNDRSIQQLVSRMQTHLSHYRQGQVRHKHQN